MYGINFTLSKNNFDSEYEYYAFTVSIQDELERSGFYAINNNLYVHDDFNPVECVLLVQQLSNIFPEIKKHINQISMLRIDSIDDLHIAI